MHASGVVTVLVTGQIFAFCATAKYSLTDPHGMYLCWYVASIYGLTVARVFSLREERIEGGLFGIGESLLAYMDTCYIN
jgi:hypothetical protein